MPAGEREVGSWKNEDGRGVLRSILYPPFSILIVIGALLASLSSSAMAQEKNSDAHVIVSGDPRTAASDKEIGEVRNLAELTLRGLELGDTSLIEGYLSPDYFCIDVAGNAIDRFARLKQIKESGLKFTSATTEKQSIRLHENTMLVTGLIGVKGSVSDRDISGQYRYLDVWLKRSGKWVVVASTMTRVQPSASAAPAK